MEKETKEDPEVLVIKHGKKIMKKFFKKHHQTPKRKNKF